jgi:hypothetical protein
MHLKLKKEQLEHFSRLQRSSFVERMRAIVREEFPEKTAPMSDAEVDGILEKGISTASSYGVESERDVGRYIYLMFALGFEFDRDASAAPWAGEILRQTRASAQVRMDMVWAMFEGRLLNAPEGSPFFP